MPDRTSPFAHASEIRRYLIIEPADLKRLVKIHHLPVTWLSKPTRPVMRVYLPDFHRWLLQRTKGASPKLENYSDFLTHFEATAARRRPEEAEQEAEQDDEDPGREKRRKR